jgi:hypothetical protein
MFKRGLPPLAMSLGLGGFLLLMPLLALGDPSTLTIGNASVAVTSSAPTALLIHIARTVDRSCGAFVQYQTQDGTAVARTDYTTASGSVIIPAGQVFAKIGVTVAGGTTNPPDKTFKT